MSLCKRINHQIKYRIIKKLAEKYGFLASEPNTFDYKKQLEENTHFYKDMRNIRDKRTDLFLDDGRNLTLTIEGLEDALAGLSLQGKKILEVGPKYGIHAQWIDNNLSPSEMVFCDFKSDSKLHETWKDKIQCKHKWMYGDIRNTTKLFQGKQFDFALFLGVLYHSIYHIQILSALNKAIKLGGKMLLESTYESMPGSYVLLRWVNTKRAKAHPTLDALRLMLAFTGWRKVTQFINYRPSSSELLFLCEKTDNIEKTDHDTCDIVIPHKE